jgi:HrpA-like RNA helicase
VIVSTSISETSVTIDGVVYVVDAGFQRLPYFNPDTGVEVVIIYDDGC